MIKLSNIYSIVAQIVSRRQHVNVQVMRTFRTPSFNHITATPDNSQQPTVVAEVPAVHPRK
jgi:hypothetical protein